MVLDMSRISDLQIKSEALVKMRKLRFLKFYLPYSFQSSQKKSKILLPGGLLSLPNELRCLCWMGYPSKTLPSRFDPGNLVELDIRDSNVEQLWEGKQDIVNLKKIALDFSENLVRTPDLSKI
ncbi:hypothetical protein like AT5G17680 [Hibiscus trionum]|uniref:Uncharacterized protein n=2 Tax=Hibiscus trionum TaxID=183268 RepID=A0A9W7GSZ5_HIBTR|nr:hypothetical protein like AT5G17680 [Hibiscus trionum]